LTIKVCGHQKVSSVPLFYDIGGRSVRHEKSFLRFFTQKKKKDFLANLRSLKRQARPSAPLPTLQDERSA